MAMTKFYHDSLQYNADNNNIEYIAIHKTASLSLGIVFYIHDILQCKWPLGRPFCFNELMKV